MSFRRIPKEIDPRRPPKRRELAGDEGRQRESRSYGQYVDTSQDEIEEFEELTGEVVREGDDADAAGTAAGGVKGESGSAEREEFEELAGEPMRENGERSG